jgi:hypothetical protein
VVVFREVAVNEDVVKLNAFALQCLEYEVVDWPEGVLRERVCSESVLVAHHYKLKIEVLAYEAEVAEYTLHEFQFLKAVYLFVGRLLDKCAVAVYE